MDAKSKVILDRLGKDLQNKNFQGTDFSNADLRYFNFSGCDLRGVDFSSADLTGANFCRVKMGIAPIDTMLIFLAMLIMATAASIAGVVAGETFHLMFNSASRPGNLAGVLSLFFTILFIVIVTWTGIGKSFKMLMLPVVIAATVMGLIGYFIGGGNGIGMFCLMVCLLLGVVMLIAGTIARVTVGSLSHVMFIFVALAGTWFSGSIGGGVGMMIMGVSCAMISKRALTSANLGILRRIAYFITEKFGTSFRNSRLSSARFYRCSIRNTDFSNADLKFVTWDHCEPVNCKISITPIEKLKLRTQD